MFLRVNLRKSNAVEKNSRKLLQEPTYPFSLNLICQTEVIYIQSVCIVTILSIKSFKSSKILIGCIAHLTLLPMLKRNTNGFTRDFG